MDVCVVGLGKMGLPMAVQIAGKGHHVHGADIDPRTCDLVNAGLPPFPNEEGLEDALADVVRSGRLEATTDTTAATKRADAVIVLVPLVVDDDHRPSFAGLDAATRAIGDGLQPGTLVCYETTLPVGTTRDRFVPMLEERSGLRCGVDFWAAFSPERVFSGRVFRDLRRYPKLVGGTDDRSTAEAMRFYETILDFDDRDDLQRPNGVWNLGSAEAAELAKLAETTYRDLNIGFANELARFSDRIGVDVYAVIEAANSQPFSHIHRPGIAVGGHCIPVYPRFLLAGNDEFELPRLAREVNESMPRYAVDCLASELGDLFGLRVAVLGVTYRGDVKETAFSGAFPLLDALSRRGAHALVHDPLFTDGELRDLGLQPYELGTAIDAAIIQADHSSYRSLTPADLPGARLLLDGRGVTAARSFEDAGIRRVMGARPQAG